MPRALQSISRTPRFAARVPPGLVTALLLAHGAGLAADTNEFLARVHTNATRHVLPYRLLLPKHYEPGRSYPLVLFLHGAAGRGTNNVKPLDWGPLLLAEPGVRDKHDFFLVVPQCPRGESWTTGSATPGPDEPLMMALDLVGTILPGEFRLDPKRRYLTGVSMGGHAAWLTLIRRPGFFAAAVPVCSGGDSSTVTKAAARCPVWAFHSDDDPLVPVDLAREMVKAWRSRGGVAKYTEYTGLKHSSWKKAYADPELFDWLFQQRLP